MSIKNPGIHIRLLVAVFALITATTFTLGYIGVNISRQFVETRFEERISFLARHLALNAELGILIDDRSMLTRLAGNILSERDVMAVSILDKDDNVLGNRTKEISSSFHITEEPVFLRESQEEIRAFKLDTNGGTGKKLIGKVRITYSTEGIDQLTKTMGNRFIWLSAGLACLAGFIFYFLSRSLVAPVTQLAQATRQVADGNLDFRVQPGTLPETRELAVAFNAMLDSLEKSREDLDQASKEMMRQNALAEMGKFSLMVAHEVKNPLSIIKSSLDVLKQEVSISSDNTMVLYMEDEIRRLNRLIEDFLSFAHPARPHFRQVDIVDLLNQIAVKFELQNPGFSAEIKSDLPAGPFYMDADPDLLTRAIGNILKNGFEANGGKGTVNLTISIRKNNLIIDIEDEGKGIAPEDIHQIFDPFFTTRSKGTGLGLAYVTQVIKTHNGNITARNRGQGGACFSAEIPVCR